MKKSIKDIIVTMFNSKKYNGLHITTNHTGKMAGMYSLSTCAACNEYCKAYAKDPNKVCSKCYANTMLKRYSTLNKALSRNTEILTSSVLALDILPTINALYFRLEAFGDLNNDIQVINYFNICNKNKGVHFALWTKNPFFISQAINKGYEKPANLQIILSSHYLNVEADKANYPFIDKVFTVYTPDYIESNNITINCGSRSCLNCGKCYKKRSCDTINEKLK